MSRKYSKEEFTRSISFIGEKSLEHGEYLYEIYSFVYDGLIEISKSKEVGQSFEINNPELIFYILGEFVYSITGLTEEQIKKFVANEKFQESISNVVADKYISLSIYNHSEKKLTNKYFPPISSLELYLNLMLNLVNNSQMKDKSNALLIDFLNKTLSIGRCILKQLCDGYDVEAFALWRTLHECECVLMLLDKYKDFIIPVYVRHMQYGMIYKQGETDNEINNKIFAQLKEELKSHGLKSKDMKKFIEYGWTLAIPDVEKIPNFKLNFRDGVETLAGLHAYSDIYMTSSEILHGSPMLIYSNKTYFHMLTIISVYESFFRIERVFESLFFPKINEEARNKYLQMKKLYFSQLLSIHKREVDNFNKYTKHK